MSQPAFQPLISYDPEYAIDISRGMNVPERIRVAEGSNSSWSFGYPSNTVEFPSMSVPEKIVVVGRDQSIGVKEEPKLHQDLVTLPSSNDFLNVSTPPRVLTLAERPLLAAEESLSLTDKSKMKGWNSRLGKFGNGSEAALIRRQLSYLSQQITKLEVENMRRSRREMVLYPILVGYVLFRVIRWAMKQ